jgi:hypothetical protein
MLNREPDPANGEGKLLLEAIAAELPSTIDARTAINSMRLGGSRNWKQMEWIGFYPEFWFENRLSISLDASHGPRFGNMTFDIKRRYVWDLKAHSTGGSGWAPLNDIEAIRACIDRFDGVGFLVISGPCTYDEDGSFKAWHDELKGGQSDYSRRIADRGARSRRRKTSFSPDHLIAFRFSTQDQLDQAMTEGWVKGFQEGMRNSNDTERRKKVMVDLMRIGKWSIVTEIHR